MSTSKVETANASGGYRYIPAVSQYSAGVAALPGFRLERVRFSKPVALREGFERIEAIIKATGAPLNSFAACELRSPAPFTEQGFKDFNAVYTGVLSSWGVIGDGVNPVSRSNVCPAVNPPAEPSFHAFTFAVKDDNAAPSFVIAGSAEAAEGGKSYAETTVRLGETTPDAIREKAIWVLNEMERRMSPFDGTWANTTAVQIYTVHDIHPFVEDELGRRGALANGMTWFFNRPPVNCLEYEMDVRRIHVERIVDV
ncbi:MAG TPA: hypothetical protein VNZ94_12490 [Xanthobacteraceae bacterium]|nr:hypothetical protein [Xanthobacteraceae bacterium]